MPTATQWPLWVQFEEKTTPAQVRPALAGQDPAAGEVPTGKAWVTNLPGVDLSGEVFRLKREAVMDGRELQVDRF